MSVLTPDLLEDAAVVMEQRGLAQLVYFDECDGSCCILGAIAIARGYAPPTVYSEEVDEFVEEPLSELAVLMGQDPVLFSDTHGVTTADVAAALRRAAAACGASGSGVTE